MWQDHGLPAPQYKLLECILHASQPGRILDSKSFQVCSPLDQSPLLHLDAQRVRKPVVPLPQQTLGIALDHHLLPRYPITIARTAGGPTLQMPTGTALVHNRLTWISLATRRRSVTSVGAGVLADPLRFATDLMAWLALAGLVAKFLASVVSACKECTANLATRYTVLRAADVHYLG
jgi:hypothetical protein